jgi:hypothetical protein
MGNSKRGKSLKSSLATHQKRQGFNAVAVARQAAVVAKGKGKGKLVKKKVEEKRYTVPFCPEDKILLIGEGECHYYYFGEIRSY